MTTRTGIGRPRFKRSGILERGPLALPPETPNGRPFGTTLKFHIDLFVDGIEDTLEPTFEVIRHLNQSLKLAIELYKISVK
ncbi:hypothetical protein [Paenibacillus apiarius]|uniref:Uncharacterized protein n=1 Tax=Paenibacillus apiarius TaxID=46240 RepID=A0ABT4E1G6_9BACL|nr:hypothetical protein [Paenibacillus apiarius]MCY9514113.1 hypothetical protein [Paenibacillus apiarius]MCY9523436.1 hypothetical protein [Paenibacillus apiarius]MCY9555612.1 hypothetical protein [Paenibacillus apiarius]MCY9561577.1 hypothetical protein [Paenibacillus apiarius]MCY9687191.1 hypothetical protein [Paenibacillus apiarius]